MEQLNGTNKKLSKVLGNNPNGFVSVDLVASIPLRLFRINSATSPKQTRVDKSVFDELMSVSLKELHSFAWKIVSYLFDNLEIGTEVFEVELAELIRDQIKTILKSSSSDSIQNLNILDKFCDLITSDGSTFFSGHVFVRNLLRSDIFVEISNKGAQEIVKLLHDGLSNEKEFNSVVSSNKRARYHQVSETDQKRQENLEKEVSVRIFAAFDFFSRSIVIFKSSTHVISTNDHIAITENLMLVLTSLIQSQHKYPFLSEDIETKYFPILYSALSSSTITFQPAYLPPFLPLALNLLSQASSRPDRSGLESRKALLKLDLMIHPRRSGPFSIRPASELIKQVFECDEIVVEAAQTQNININTTPAIGNPHFEEFKVESIPITMIAPTAAPIAAFVDLTKSAKSDTQIQTQSIPIPFPPVQMVTNSTPTSSSNANANLTPINNITTIKSNKKTLQDKIDEDDEDVPLPEIIDCEPDQV